MEVANARSFACSPAPDAAPVRHRHCSRRDRSMSLDLAAAAPPNRAVGAPPAASAPDPRSASSFAAARHAAEDFEAFFFAQTLESMYSGMETDKLFGGGQGETVYRSMLLQEYGKAAAHAGGVGIADQVYREVLRLQEAKP
jgi:peptidoglycan hydrolase FlgJ